MDLNNKYFEEEIYEFACQQHLFITDCTSAGAVSDETSLPEITLSDEMEGEPIYQFVYTAGWEDFQQDSEPLFTLLYINQ